VRAFLSRVSDHGMLDRCRLIAYERGSNPTDFKRLATFGGASPSVEEIVTSADAVWDFASGGPPSVVSLFKRRVLLDGDPGHLQVAAVQLGQNFEQYDKLLTVGLNVGLPNCGVPTLGRHWEHFPQVVYLPSWPMQSGPGPGPNACLTTVTHWNWGELELAGRTLSISKRDAYLRYLDLPRTSARCFESRATLSMRRAQTTHGPLRATAGGSPIQWWWPGR